MDISKNQWRSTGGYTEMALGVKFLLVKRVNHLLTSPKNVYIFGSVPPPPDDYSKYWNSLSLAMEPKRYLLFFVD